MAPAQCHAPARGRRTRRRRCGGSAGTSRHQFLFFFVLCEGLPSVAVPATCARRAAAAACRMARAAPRAVCARRRARPRCPRRTR